LQTSPGMAFIMNVAMLMQCLVILYAGRLVANQAEDTAVPYTKDDLHWCTDGCPYDVSSFAGVSNGSCLSRGLTRFTVTCSTASTLADQDAQALLGVSSAVELEAAMAELGSVVPCPLNPGSAYTAMMTVTTAFLFLSVIIRPLVGFGEALKSCHEMFVITERPSPIDPFSEEGKRLKSIEGVVELVDVSFAYPAAPERFVCQGYSLRIEAGQCAALVGPSGSGKSTIIALLERFYDPQGGRVLLDGVDLRELNVRWLRSQLGLVGQEPVLFMGSVAENISYGAVGKASREEVEGAAKLANAHGFISESLPEAYETDVGIGGSRLSGGQKQRVAIARALVRQPSVLLLDEATSALDNESEKVVQAALDEVMAKQKRTTIVVAHRLSTIRNADLIAVVSGGQVAEQGTHDELMVAEGLYSDLHSLAMGS